MHRIFNSLPPAIIQNASKKWDDHKGYRCVDIALSNNEDRTWRKIRHCDLIQIEHMSGWPSWSKAPVSGTGPKGHGFESHSWHFPSSRGTLHHSFACNTQLRVYHHGHSNHQDNQKSAAGRCSANCTAFSHLCSCLYLELAITVMKWCFVRHTWTHFPPCR